MSIDGFGNGVRLPSGGLIELHEDQVPELHEPVAGRIAERATLGTEGRAAIDVDLAARPARPGFSGLPEVVLVAEALDPLHRHADHLVPDRLGLVVGLVHGDPQSVAVEAPPTVGRVCGDQFPAPGDRRLLEVVAEAEVAEHLEEDQVALGPPDVVEIVVFASGACALLRAHGTKERWLLVADEVRLEGKHACNVEQHGGVVRDETRRGHDDVILRCEEVAEGVAQLVGVHRNSHGSGEPIDAGSLLPSE